MYWRQKTDEKLINNITMAAPRGGGGHEGIPKRYFLSPENNFKCNEWNLNLKCVKISQNFTIKHNDKFLICIYF